MNSSPTPSSRSVEEETHMSFPWAEHYEPKARSCAGSTSGCRCRAWSITRSAAAIRCRATSTTSGTSASSPAPALGIQIVTGIVLAMHYAAVGRPARSQSVEHIMRDVNAGWLLRYAHANGAELLLHRHLYPHLPRPLLRLLQGAARDGVAAGRRHLPPDDGHRLHGLCASLGPDELLGRAGDHRLLLGAIPLVGEPIRVWLLGGFAPDQAALNRFFSLHYLLPFVIAAVIILHIWALHIPGSNNPTGVDVKERAGYACPSTPITRPRTASASACS